MMYVFEMVLCNMYHKYLILLLITYKSSSFQVQPVLLHNEILSIFRDIFGMLLKISQCRGLPYTIMNYPMQTVIVPKVL